ncbi:hypothetical protein UA08_04720 [Talaromyces atroroseus]|uniref:Uncharacterized protein n=1 Tax=Talaromyces atroroseus TaxID=1441469 RepID=A0A225AEV0_TALAT|nr:hypothetical protein UA08_04720 [Talaromyces atroroseus]OKL59822.1 hypothetical protein UA08_04720 [Talaromyces atroroseus]
MRSSSTQLSQPIASMEYPYPHSLELRTEWNGDTASPATIRVILQVQARPHSSLTILKNIDDLGLTESDLFDCKTSYIGLEAPDNSSDDDMKDDHDSPPSLDQGQPNEGAHDSPENASRISQLLQSQKNDSTSQELCSDDGQSDGQTTIKAPNNNDAASLRSLATTPRPSKIPIRKFDLDGASDGPDPSEPWSAKDGDADTVHKDSTYSDLDLDLPPSPTPSSQDLFPWTSTKDIVSRMEESESDSSLLAGDAYIRRNDGNLVFYVSSQGKEGLYRVEVISHQFLNQNLEGWYMLDLSDIIVACPNVPGKFVLDIPLDRSFEHKISGLDDVQESDGCFQSSFDPRERPFVFFQIRERESENNGVQDVQTKVYQTHLADEEADAGDQGDIDEPENGIKSTAEQVETKGAPPRKSSSCPARRSSPENALREQFLFILQWLLPAVFLSTVFICALIGGPPEAIATPSNTFRTVGRYANHIRARLETHVNTSQHYINDQDPNHSETTPVPTIVLDELQLDDIDIGEDTSPQQDENDTLESDMCFLPWAGPIDYYGPVCASGLIFADKPLTSKEMPPSRRDGSSKALSRGAFISSFAVEVFRHVACSTSVACTMAQVSDYKDPTWEVFERYYCGENGRWRPTTIRDRVDYLLGWTPPECWED